MARAFQPEGDRLVATLDADERAVVISVCAQVASLVAPTAETTKGESADPFEQIVAGLGDLTRTTDESAAGAELPDRAFGLAEERDPALDRLFPTGNREDEHEAAEFRRFTEQGLRQRKHTNLTTTIASLEEAVDDRWELPRDRAPAVLVALTDVRLVMGERLGLRTDEDATRLEELVGGLEPDDPAVFVMNVYDFFTWLQDSLTSALTAGTDDGDEPGSGAEVDA